MTDEPIRPRRRMPPYQPPFGPSTQTAVPLPEPKSEPTPHKSSLDIAPGEEKEVLVTLEDCGWCEKAKDIYADDLSSGKMEEVHCDQHDPDCEAGRNFEEMQRLGVNAFPTRLRFEGTPDGIKVCERDINSGKIEKCHIIQKKK